MKEDILEQLVDGYFSRQNSTFTKHNVKYKPRKDDIKELNKLTRSRYAVSSDIDVLAIHLNEKYEKRVSAISCKSWQDGFNIDWWYETLTNKVKRQKKDQWKRFRELVEPIWAKAFRDKVYEQTKSKDFTYYIAVTKLTKVSQLENFTTCDLFLENLSDNGKNKVKIEFLTLEKMLKDIFDSKKDTTLEATEIGRFIQLIKAANLKIE